MVFLCSFGFKVSLLFVNFCSTLTLQAAGAAGATFASERGTSESNTINKQTSAAPGTNVKTF